MLFNMYCPLAVAFFVASLAGALSAEQTLLDKHLDLLFQTLDSADVVEVRIAQATIAREGKKCLPYLDRALEQATPQQRERLRELGALLLLRSLPYDELKSHKKLLELIQADTKEIAAAIDQLEKAKDYLRPLYASEEEPVYSEAKTIHAARELLLDRGGYAIPLLIEKTKNGSPVFKLYAAEILIGLCAEGQLPTLLEFTRHSVPIKYFDDDVTINTTLGDMVYASLLRTHPFHRRFSVYPGEKICFEAEDYLRWLNRFQKVSNKVDVVNSLRSEAKTMEAESWNDYWTRSRPLLRKFWAKERMPD